MEMKIKVVGLRNEHDITKVEVIYDILTNEERDEFYEKLVNFDQKGEAERYGYPEVIKYKKFIREVVASAVLSGQCEDDEVLEAARDEHFYFIREKKEAAEAA